MRLTKERKDYIQQTSSQRYVDSQEVKAMNRELLTELDALQQDYHKALDALTVTQEEWLLRVKRLESKLEELKTKGE